MDQPRPHAGTRARVSARTTLLVALALGILAGCRNDPAAERLKRHQTSFPPSASVADMPSAAWPLGIGQIEALAAHVVASPEDVRHVVEIGGTWCNPCVKTYPGFVAAAGAGEKGLRFAHVAFELDDPAADGLEAHVSQQWNSGAEPTFPSYVVLDARGKPLTPLAFNDLAAALDAARKPVDPAAAEAHGTGAVVGDEAAWADFLASMEPVVVELDTKTMADVADQLEKQTGARIVLDRRIADRLWSMKGKTLHLGAFQTLRGPYPFIAVAGRGEQRPLLVLWDLPAPAGN